VIGNIFAIAGFPDIESLWRKIIKEENRLWRIWPIPKLPPQTHNGGLNLRIISLIIIISPHLLKQLIMPNNPPIPKTKPPPSTTDGEG
jgi:hypothetical protein